MALIRNTVLAVEGEPVAGLLCVTASDFDSEETAVDISEVGTVHGLGQAP